MFVRVADIGTDLGVVSLTINHPQALNAVNEKVIEHMHKCLDQIEKRDDVTAVIFHSHLRKAFCAGVDTKYVASLTNEEAERFFVALARLLERVVMFPKVTVAAIHGYAFGCGADLALACDLRIASDTASFRFPGPQFGLILGTKRLIEEVGASRARFLTLTNKKIQGQQALDIGLVHELVPEGELFEQAVHYAARAGRVPASTVKVLKQLTGGYDQEEAIRATSASVMNGDFQQRFAAYCDRF